MKPKRLLTLLILSVAAISANAQSQQAMIVEMKSGEKVAFAFDDNPQIRFVADTLVVNTNIYKFAYAANTVQRYVFGDIEGTGINSPTEGAKMVNGDNLTLRLGKANAEVYVYSADGKTVLNAVSDADGTATLSLEALPSGVYIVKCDNFSTKILKR